MDDHDAQDVLKRIMLATEALARQADSVEQLTRQTAQAQHALHEAQDALRAIREREEARLRESMVALFRDQQQSAQAALRPATIRAWLAVAALVGVFVVLFAAGAWRLTHEHARQRLAEARADAAEVKAEVREASQHVEITSCGSRPCIRIDQDTPRWHGKGGEYVLVDGRPGKGGGRKQ